MCDPLARILLITQGRAPVTVSPPSVEWALFFLCPCGGVARAWVFR